MPTYTIPVSLTVEAPSETEATEAMEEFFDRLVQDSGHYSAEECPIRNWAFQEPFGG